MVLTLHLGDDNALNYFMRPAAFVFVLLITSTNQGHINCYQVSQYSVAPPLILIKVLHSQVGGLFSLAQSLSKTWQEAVSQQYYIWFQTSQGRG